MRTAILLAAALLVAGLAGAEEKKDSPVDVTVELRQQLEVGYVNGDPGKTLAPNEDILYSRTEVSTRAAFTVAEGFTLTPYLKDRLELRHNDATGLTNNLKGLRFRNRLYGGLDAGIKSGGLDLTVGVENRLATDLKDGIPQATEYRLSPNLGVAGKAKVLEGLSFSLLQLAEMYFADADSAIDQVDFEGLYKISLGLLSKPVKLAVFAEGNYVPSIYPEVSGKWALYNETVAGLSVGYGDVSLPLGLLYLLSLAEQGGTTSKNNSLWGVRAGVSFKKGPASLGLTLSLGQNTDHLTDSSQTEARLTTVFGVKY